jgi:hypothetical protein
LEIFRTDATKRGEVKKAACPKLGHAVTDRRLIKYLGRNDNSSSVAKIKDS